MKSRLVLFSWLYTLEHVKWCLDSFLDWHPNYNQCHHWSLKQLSISLISSARHFSRFDVSYTQIKKEYSNWISPSFEYPVYRDAVAYTRFNVESLVKDGNVCRFDRVGDAAVTQEETKEKKKKKKTTQERRRKKKSSAGIIPAPQQKGRKKKIIRRTRRFFVVCAVQLHFSVCVKVVARLHTIQ